MAGNRFAALACASIWLLCTAPGAAADAATVVYLLRHAEPVYPPPGDDPRNPPLNEAGKERSEQLAHVLRGAGVTRIFSSGYRRTDETAAPLAARLDLEVEAYDPGTLEEFAGRLLALEPGARVLVSGHSNTTHDLVRLLGGDPGPPIDDRTEFDRLYVVTLLPGRPPVTVLLHYGRPPGPGPPSE